MIKENKYSFPCEFIVDKPDKDKEDKQVEKELDHNTSKVLLWTIV
jgi:hypothetical protein